MSATVCGQMLRDVGTCREPYRSELGMCRACFDERYASTPVQHCAQHAYWFIVACLPCWRQRTMAERLRECCDA